MSPIFAPQLRASPHCVQGPCRASRPAHVWSALRGNELRQKVLWVPRKDARRRADFSDTRYEHCTASSKTATTVVDVFVSRPCHSKQRSEKYTHRLAPFLGNHDTYCDRSSPQARQLATPNSRCCKDPSVAWATTQNSATRRRTELVVDRAPLPVIRAS